MRAPPGAPDWLRVFTAAERPDLWEHVRSEHAFDVVWPEYNLDGNHTVRDLLGAVATAAPSAGDLPVARREARLTAPADDAALWPVARPCPG